MFDKQWHIVFAEPFDDHAVERARSVAQTTVLESCDPSTLADAIQNCDALLVRSYSRITPELLARAGRLRVIGRGGVGVDNINVQAARDRGITVVHTPAAATDAVAELTVGLIVAVLRGFVAGDGAVRAGRFHEARRAAKAIELRELTLGVVGFGRIGRAVARRCRHAFNMRVVYHDIVAPGQIDFVATPLDKQRLLAEADIVSLHVPLTATTHHLVDAAALAAMKSSAILINTARGGVVDSQALAMSLESKELAGAALDVVEPEPLPPDHALLAAPGVLFTPHIGARTTASLARMNGVIEDVIRVLEGQQPECEALPA